MKINEYNVNTPSAILKKLSLKPENQSFFSKSNLSAIDVGCGIPINLISLYHDFHFENLIGIDIQNELTIVDNWYRDHPIAKNPTLLQASSFYDFYLKNINPNDADIQNRRSFLSKTDFYMNIQFIPNMPLANYFNSLNPEVKFDYIILENIIHLLNSDEQDYLFDKVHHHMAKNGLIHIYVHHCDYQVQNQNPISEDRLISLLNGYYEEIIKEHFYVESTTRKKSILFVGWHL